jgi:hypothetical protein
MGAILTFLQGKKTYVVGVGAIVAAIVAWTTGSIPQSQAIEAIIAAVMGMLLRSGMNNAVKSIEPPK